MNFRSGASLLGFGNISFSGGNYDSIPVGESNILNGSREYGSYNKINEDRLTSVIGTSLNGYLNRMQELSYYKENSISKTVLDILKDTLVSLITDSDDLISIKDISKKSELKVQDAINGIFKDIAIKDHIKSDLESIIYYGSCSYRLVENKKKYKLRYLNHPNKVITVFKDNLVDKYITFSLGNEIIELNREEIISITTNDHILDVDSLLYLKNISKDQKGDPKKDVLDSFDKRYLGGSPLYNNISLKIKEYILKDYLIAQLGIKELIQPSILLIGVDNNSDKTDALELSLMIEDLINKNIDFSYLESSYYDIKKLAKTLIDNIRVIPDFNNKLSGMTDLNLDKLADKINTVRQEQETLKEELLNSLGIPYDLFKGQSTRWEQIKTSQRFNSKVSYYAEAINNSILTAASILYKSITNDKDDIDVIKEKMSCKFVSVERLVNSNFEGATEFIKDKYRGFIEIIDSMDRVNEDDVDKFKLKQLLVKDLGNLDKDLADVIISEEEELDEDDKDDKDDKKNSPPSRGRFSSVKSN